MRYHTSEHSLLERAVAGHIESSASVDWNTPAWVIERLNKLWGRIGLDPCSNPGSIVNALFSFLLPFYDGLVDPWHEVEGERVKSVYVNPPFGAYYQHDTTDEIMAQKPWRAHIKAIRDEHGDKAADAEKKLWTRHTIVEWIKRCEDTWQNHGVDVVQLGPASVDTKHWQKHIFKTATAALMIEGRMKFTLEVTVATEDGEVTSIETGPAPMACALVYWGKDPDEFERLFSDCGTVIRLDLLRGRAA